MDTEIEKEVDNKEEVEVTEPELYRVIFHNDDYTTFQFVMTVLVQIFDKSPREASEITLQVHNDGYAIAGIYTYEIAEQKTEETTHTAKLNGFPLKVTFEKD